MDVVQRMENIKAKFLILKAKKNEYALGDTLTEQQVLEFEKRNHLRLPEDYRWFIIHMGYGAGQLKSGYRLDLNAVIDNTFPLRYGEMYSSQHFIKEEDGYLLIDTADAVTSYSSILIGHIGALPVNLILRGEAAGTLWSIDFLSDENGAFPFSNPYEQGKPMTFADWYEYWLDCELDGEQPDYISFIRIDALTHMPIPQTRVDAYMDSIYYVEPNADADADESEDDEDSKTGGEKSLGDIMKAIVEKMTSMKSYRAEPFDETIYNGDIDSFIAQNGFVYHSISAIDRRFLAQNNHMYFELMNEIEKLKKKNKTLSGFMLWFHPVYGGLQAWEMKPDGTHLKDLFMLGDFHLSDVIDTFEKNSCDDDDEDEDDDSIDEESCAEDDADDYDDDDYDDDDDLFGDSYEDIITGNNYYTMVEAGFSLIAYTLMRMHKDGVFDGLVKAYPFSVYVNLEDEGQYKVLTLLEEKGLRPKPKAVTGMYNRMTSNEKLGLNQALVEMIDGGNPEAYQKWREGQGIDC